MQWASTVTACIASHTASLQRLVSLHTTLPDTTKAQRHDLRSALCRPVDMPASLEQSQCRWIGRVADLQAMVHSLQGIDMLAVDVEHHHVHSYLGFVCLLQLSTG